MKYLENAGLEYFSNFLTGREMGGCVLDGRIEAFSCKRAGEDKRLSKVLEAKMVEEMSHSPPSRKRSTSLGDLNEVSTRRLLIDLISTLNASFPDYDFSTVSPEAFVQRDLKYALHCANSHLAELTASNPSILEEMWNSIDEVISLRNCEIYSYVPDMNEDPFSDGTLWSFNFFLFNKELKRICYFTCMARSVLKEAGKYGDEDEDDPYGGQDDDDFSDMDIPSQDDEAF
mmetsp:Transcript_24425/g.35893  ORF Transcript_24425/g.35893 Transcript_24425/m.35893 type:complete len:230 (+) Transcript_24425:63-752(+)